MKFAKYVTLFVVLAAASAPNPAAAQSCDRASRLAFVASSHSADIAELVALLDAGVGIDCYSTGKTALMHAARWRSHAALAYLLERGADAALRSTDDGWTALQYAVSEGDAEASRLLASHLGVPDPLAPPRPETAPPAARHKPQRPVRPSAAPRPVPTVDDTSDDTRWAPFGTYRVGDRVQYWTPSGWWPGTVTDIGSARGVEDPVMGRVYELKYRVSDERFYGDGDWYDWGTVAGLEREPWWTSYFVGDWALGETMGVNTYVEGRTETTEVAYGSATETLRIQADGTYVWRGYGQDPIRGRWTPAEEVPGIVLVGGPEGTRWTMFNQTNAIEENIRGIETARLFAQGKMSIAAKRPSSRTERNSSR